MPRTEAECILSGIWSELLKLERVGLRDNFFHLGGDSILSIQVVARARQSGLLLTPRQIFEHPTLAALASVAETISQTIDKQGDEQGRITGDVSLTPIQRWFFEQNPHPHTGICLSCSKRTSGWTPLLSKEHSRTCSSITMRCVSGSPRRIAARRTAGNNLSPIAKSLFDACAAWTYLD